MTNIIYQAGSGFNQGPENKRPQKSIRRRLLKRALQISLVSLSIGIVVSRVSLFIDSRQPVITIAPATLTLSQKAKSALKIFQKSLMNGEATVGSGIAVLILAALRVKSTILISIVGGFAPVTYICTKVYTYLLK